MRTPGDVYEKNLMWAASVATKLEASRSEREGEGEEGEMEESEAASTPRMPMSQKTHMLSMKAPIHVCAPTLMYA